jgi:long-chain acyl-CoA synthetase
MGDAAIWRIRPAELDVRAAAAATGLARAGARRGDRVVLSAATSPALLAVTVGALRSGVVPVLLDPALTPAERDAIVADAGPRLVITDGAALDELVAGGGPPPPSFAPVPLGRPMHYTSGTSGAPKGVWPGVLAEDDAVALYEDEAGTWALGPSDVTLVCSPLHHSAPVRFAVSTLLRGGDVVLVAPFDAATVLHAVAAHQPTVAFLVPSHLQRLFALADVRAGAVDLAPLRSFRLVAHAGEPCPEPLKRRAFDTFGGDAVWEFYGSTEGQFTVCSPGEWMARPGTVGRARRGRTLSVDADGVVWCAAPSWARFSYWNDPEKTAAAWRGDAFTVGDIGRVDGDGFLFLDGRRDDLVISGGVNVYPAEVESVLAGVDGVRAVAVFGAADERWGQRVCAAVVGAVDAAALEARAGERLAPYKRPKQYVFVDDLPRTSTGKVKRAAIAVQLGLA